MPGHKWKIKPVLAVNPNSRFMKVAVKTASLKFSLLVTPLLDLLYFLVPSLPFFPQGKVTDMHELFPVFNDLPPSGHMNTFNVRSIDDVKR